MLCVANIFISLSDETGDGVDLVRQIIYFLEDFFYRKRNNS